MSDAETLHELLDADPEVASLVDSLDPDEARRLTVLLAEARAAEAADVDEGVDGLLAAVPSPLRGRLRRVLHRDQR